MGEKEEWNLALSRSWWHTPVKKSGTVSSGWIFSTGRRKQNTPCIPTDLSQQYTGYFMCPLHTWQAQWGVSLSEIWSWGCLWWCQKYGEYMRGNGPTLLWEEWRPRAPSVSNDREITTCACSLFIPFPSFFESRSLSESPSLTSLCHLCIPLQTSLNSLFSKGSSEFECLAWSRWPLTEDAVTTSLWAQKHFSPLMAI